MVYSTRLFFAWMAGEVTVTPRWAAVSCRKQGQAAHTTILRFQSLLLLPQKKPPSYRLRKAAYLSVSPVPGAILGHHFLKTSSSRGCKQRWRLKDEGQGGGSVVKGTQHHAWWPEIDSWVSLVEAVKKWFLPSCPQTSTHTPQGMCPHTHTKEN